MAKTMTVQFGDVDCDVAKLRECFSRADGMRLTWQQWVQLVEQIVAAILAAIGGAEPPTATAPPAPPPPPTPRIVR